MCKYIYQPVSYSHKLTQLLLSSSRCHYDHGSKGWICVISCSLWSRRRSYASPHYCTGLTSSSVLGRAPLDGRPSAQLPPPPLPCPHSYQPMDAPLPLEVWYHCQCGAGGGWKPSARSHAGEVTASSSNTEVSASARQKICDSLMQHCKCLN